MASPSLQDQPPRLFASLRRLFATATGMAHTRLALAGLELEEELQRLTGLLLGMVGVLVFGTLGLLMLMLMLMLTLTVVLFVDATRRVTVLAIFALAYPAMAGWFLWRIQRALATRPPFLQATLAEVAKDNEALQAASTPVANPEAANE